MYFDESRHEAEGQRGEGRLTGVAPDGDARTNRSERACPTATLGYEQELNQAGTDVATPTGRGSAGARGRRGRAVARGAVAALTLASSVAAGAAVSRTQEVPPAAAQPFAWFRSALTVSSDQQRRLDDGDVLIEPLPASGKQVGFFAAVAVRADPDVLLDRLRHLTEFREGPTTPITRQFSSPPRLDDLAELTLPEKDLENLRGCRPGDCRLKLTADEIAHLRKAVQRGDADWKQAAQSAFREIVLERLRTYQQRGLSGLAPYVSSNKPLKLGDRFDALLQQMTVLREQLPEVASYLGRYPTVTQPDIDVAFYWTIEHLRKPVVTVRQVVILHGRGEAGRPEVLSVDKQLFALHYVDAQLSLTALVRGARQNYLVHVNYSEIDLLDGFVAWLRRLLIERGVQKEARGLLFETRRRLERRAVELASDERPAAPKRSAARPM